jgi:hypothetical protein
MGNNTLEFRQPPDRNGRGRRCAIWSWLFSRSAEDLPPRHIADACRRIGNAALALAGIVPVIPRQLAELDSSAGHEDDQGEAGSRAR